MTSPNPQPIYLTDITGKPWLIRTDNNAIPQAVGVLSVPPGLSTQPYIYITDVVTGNIFKITVLPDPANPTYTPAGTLFWAQVTGPSGSIPTQIPVSAPNGTVYCLQISNGILQVALPNFSTVSCYTSISSLAGNVQDRLQEPRGPGIFWDITTEIYTGIVEAINDLMIMVGRPTISVNTVFNLTPNTVWQTVPKGVFLISDIIGLRSALRRVTLNDMDYVQSSWGPDWECDTDPNGPVRWGPIGLTQFFVHPAPSVPMQVNITSVPCPVSEPWPYNGNEVIPFEHHFFEALEMYGAHYCRIKEGGTEFRTSMELYGNYLDLAKRMTTIQDRRDPLIFSRMFGATAGLNPITKR